MTGSWNLDMLPAYWALDAANRTRSLYQFNPMDMNPIRDILADQIDFERVRACDQLQLFVSATNVRTHPIEAMSHAEPCSTIT